MRGGTRGSVRRTWNGGLGATGFGEHRPEFVEKCGSGERLRQIVASKRGRLASRLFVHVAGQDHYGNLAEPAIASNFLDERPAVGSGEADVRDEGVGALGDKHAPALLDRVGENALITGVLEVILDDGLHRRLILNHKHLCHRGIHLLERLDEPAPGARIRRSAGRALACFGP
jgi:hypothetical protein